MVVTEAAMIQADRGFLLLLPSHANITPLDASKVKYIDGIRFDYTVFNLIVSSQARLTLVFARIKAVACAVNCVSAVYH